MEINQSQDSFLQAKLKRPVKISLFCIWSYKDFLAKLLLLDDNSKPISFVLDGGMEVTLVLDIQFASL